MTCDTSMLQGHGVSFAQCEAELVWDEILSDAVSGELKPLYGEGLRWQDNLDSPVLIPQVDKSLKDTLSLCSEFILREAALSYATFALSRKSPEGKIRSQTISTTMASLRAAKSSGVRTVMFTSDNFNKYLRRMNFYKQ